MVQKNDVVLLRDMTVARVLRVLDTPADIHKNNGNVEIEHVLGPTRGTKVFVMGGYLTTLTHDVYRKMKSEYTEKLAILDEAMAVLHHDTRMEPKNEQPNR